jgi:hypothetical protein
VQKKKWDKNMENVFPGKKNGLKSSRHEEKSVKSPDLDNRLQPVASL